MIYVWKKAKELGLSSIPIKYINNPYCFNHGYTWDQPFLDDYFQVGLKHYYEGNFEEAYWIFSHILELNPEDNINVGYYAINCCFEFGRYMAVFNICKLFPEHDQYLDFAKALAMFTTHSQEDADKQIKLVVRKFPKFAKLISQKNKKSRYKINGHNSIEEVYVFWNIQGKYWMQSPDATDRVRFFYQQYLKETRKQKM